MEDEPGWRTGTGLNPDGTARCGNRALRPPLWKVNPVGYRALARNEMGPQGLGFKSLSFRWKVIPDGEGHALETRWCRLNGIRFDPLAFRLGVVV